MEVRLAIHRGRGFSQGWIDACRRRGIPHREVDCYDTDIISHLRDCDGLLWHYCMLIPTDLLMAQQVLHAAEQMGLAVFPDVATCWHFDDKLAQKYLLEGIEAPLVPTYLFYDKGQALAWLRQATFPLVWKLRGGAGSTNVRLVQDYGEARRVCARMFGRGVTLAPAYLADMQTKVRKAESWRVFWEKLGRAPDRIRRAWRKRRLMGREIGYVLFQEFVPGNTFDTRIAVVGDRAWGFTRGVRKNDFRASGSGKINYDMARVEPECVRLAFRVARALQTQSLAFDFLAQEGRGPQLVEISYGYLAEAVHQAPGYWDPDLTWHEGHFWPQEAILDDLLAQIERRREGGEGRERS